MPSSSSTPNAMGVVMATVKETKDPKGLGRVTVTFQLKGSTVTTDWLQVMSFYGGADYGAFFLPREGDSVLVAFIQGNANAPIVLGTLWNGGIKPPVQGAEKQQDVRVIKTKQGKQLIFDDSKNGQLTLIDEKQNAITLDTANNRISIESKGDISISAAGKLNLKAREVTIQNTTGAVKLVLGASGMQANGGSSMKLNAATIELN
ncbi:Rhs element Vgr protein [Dyella sp. M7H15-1]|nr:Rhs element Vgr protein [Dyella sp. M7H15-1]